MKEIDKNVQLYIWATITTQFHLPDNNRVMLASAQQYETELPIPGKFNVKFSTKYLYVNRCNSKAAINYCVLCRISFQMICNIFEITGPHCN